jgi:hypothetical protein
MMLERESLELIQEFRGRLRRSIDIREATPIVNFGTPAFAPLHERTSCGAFAIYGRSRIIAAISRGFLPP